MRRLLLSATLALVTSTTALGCAHVRPWEREDQARIAQVLDSDRSAKAYEAHLWLVREAAVGGTGTPGGGCGCN